MSLFMHARDLPELPLPMLAYFHFKKLHQICQQSENGSWRVEKKQAEEILK